MSNCRNTYNNYGSYLRSRGYDQQICNLATQIENGQINLGIIDGNVGDLLPVNTAHTASVNGNLVVRRTTVPMPSVIAGLGAIYSVGGDVTGPANGLGIQALQGINISGPIVQSENSSAVTISGEAGTFYNSNYFKVQGPSGEHIFVGGPVDLCGNNIIDVDSIYMLPNGTNDISGVKKITFSNGAFFEVVNGGGPTGDPKLKLRAALQIDASGWIADLSGIDPTGVVNVSVDGVTQFEDRVNIDDHLDVMNTVTIHGGAGPGLDMCGNEIVDLSYVTFSNGATVNAGESDALDISYSNGIELQGGNVTIEKDLIVETNVEIDGTTIIRDQTTVDSSLIVQGNVDLSGEVRITNTTEFTSLTPGDGALFVSGGVGIAKSVGIGGEVDICGTLGINNNSASTSSSTGALVVDGGVGIGENLNVGGKTTIDNSLVMLGNIDMSNNHIVDVSSITFMNGTQFLHGNSFDISTSEHVHFVNTPMVKIDNSLTVMGNVDICGTLSVPDFNVQTMTVNVQLDCCGNTNMNTVDISGKTTIDNSLVMLGNLDMSNNHIVDVSSITFMDGTQFLHGNSFDISTIEHVHFVNTPLVKIDNSLQVMAGVDISGPTYVGGTVTISGNHLCSDLIDLSSLSLNVMNGINAFGPIIQHHNKSLVKLPFELNGTVYHEDTNIFTGRKHIFSNNNENIDTDVVIHGNLTVEGEELKITQTRQQRLILEDDTLINHKNHTFFQIFNKHENTNLDIAQVWNHSEGYNGPTGNPVIEDDGLVQEVSGKTYEDSSYSRCYIRFKPCVWRRNLQWAIDGDICHNELFIQNKTGSTDQQGQLRHLRGTSLFNPTIDGCYNIIDTDISHAQYPAQYKTTIEDISRYAMNVYGGMFMREGTTFDGSLNTRTWTMDVSTASIDISASTGQKVRQYYKHCDEAGIHVGYYKGTLKTDVSYATTDGQQIIQFDSLLVDQDKWCPIVFDKELDEANCPAFPIQIQNDNGTWASISGENIESLTKSRPHRLRAYPWVEISGNNARFIQYDVSDAPQGYWLSGQHASGGEYPIFNPPQIWNVDISHGNIFNRVDISNGRDIWNGQNNFNRGWIQGENFVSISGEIAIGYNKLRRYLDDQSYNLGGGYSTQWHLQNISIGNAAMRDISANPTPTRNIGLGNYTLQNNVSGKDNIAIGTEALNVNKDGSGNIAIGYQAIKEYDGCYNTAIGYQAMLDASGNFEGVNAIGVGVMRDASGTFDDVNAIGTQVMQDASGSFDTVNAMGHQVMQDASGTFNFVNAMGIAAMQKARGSFTNVNAFGVAAMQIAVSDASGFQNVNAIGSQAMQTAKGSFNYVNAIGSQAMQDPSGSFQNVNAFGAEVMFDASGTFNYVNAIGTGVMQDASGHFTGVNAMGAEAMHKADGSFNSVNAIGFKAMQDPSGSFDGVNAMGSQAMQRADGNFEYVNAMGYQVMQDASGEYDFVNAMGFQAMHDASGNFTEVNAIGTVVMGDASGTFNYVNAMGTGVLRKASGEYDYVNAIGNQVMRDASGHFDGVNAIGYRSMRDASGHFDYVNAMGVEVMQEATGTFNYVNAMGYQAMQEASGNFADVIAIGNNVMLDASGTVSDVIAIGKEALRDASGTFGDAIAIGKQALRNNKDADNNIAIGSEALTANTTGTPNIAIGSNALQSITDNSHNVAIGYQAGKDINAIVYSNIIGSDALGSTTADISSVNAMGYQVMQRADGNFEYVNAMGFQDLSHASGSFNFVNAIGTQVMGDASGTFTYVNAIGAAAAMEAVGEYDFVNAMGTDVMLEASGTFNNVNAIGPGVMYSASGDYKFVNAMGSEVMQKTIGDVSGVNATGFQVMQDASGTFKDVNAIGTQAMQDPSGSFDGVNAMGYQAMQDASGSFRWVNAMGYQAMQDASGSFQEVNAIGAQAMQNAVCDAESPFEAVNAIGLLVMQKATGVIAAVNAIGGEVMQEASGNFTGVNAMGYKAMQNAVSDASGSFYWVNAMGTEVMLDASGTFNYVNAIGAQAMRDTSGTFNYVNAMGYQAMQEASGNFADVIAIGNNVMLDASGMVSDVIAIGKEALSDASGTVSDVIAIGKQALKNNQQKNNIAIGSEALTANTTGNQNIAIGNKTLQNITLNTDNVVIGHNAGKDATNITDTNIIGSSAVASSDNSDIEFSNIIGFSAMKLAEGTFHEVNVIGREGLLEATGTFKDVDAIGDLVMQDASGTFQHVTCMGTQIMQNARGTFESINGIGKDAMMGAIGNEFSAVNAIGSEVMRDASGDFTNVNAIGAGVMQDACGTFHSVNAMGYLVMQNASGDFENVNAMGGLAMQDASGNFEAVNAIGYEAMQQADGSFNSVIAIGSQAMQDASGTHLRHIALGDGAMYNVQSASMEDLIGIGYRTMGNFTGTGFDNIAIGYKAMQDASGWISNNIAIGKRALQSISGGDLTTTDIQHNVVIGIDSAKNLYNSSGNHIWGCLSAKNLRKGQGNIAVGFQSLNTLVGDPTDPTISSGKAEHCIALGNGADVSGANDEYSTVIGAFAKGEGSRTVVIGNAQNGFYVKDVSNAGSPAINMMIIKENNICVGKNAGQNISQNNTKNILIGTQAGSSITDGSHNTIIGENAGTSITDGSENIVIGSLAGSSMGASDHNAIIIGDVSGNGSNTITVGNSDSSGVYIHGIRQNTSETAKTVMYNTSTKQLTYNPFITTPVGAIMMWSAPGVTLPPGGWLECDGSTLNASDYVELSQVIGVLYGGDLTAGTFNLPDMRQRFPVGYDSSVGSGFGFPGDSGGSVTIGASNLPQHTHSVSMEHEIETTTGSTTSTLPGFFNESFSSTTITTSNFTGNTGSGNGLTGNAYHQPYLTIGYIIYTGVQ